MFYRSSKYSPRLTTALVSTQRELKSLIAVVKERLEDLEFLVRIANAYREFTRAPDESVAQKEAADKLNFLDPANDYKDARDIRDAFDDQVYELQELLKPEITYLVEQAEQVVSRPEEARKFARLRNSIKRLEKFVETSSVFWPNDDSLAKLRKATLGGLSYIAKYWHRLERYQAIERNIPHGPFTLVNEYGYSPEEYEGVLTYLDRASVIIKKKGFVYLLYGDVVMTTKAAIRKYLNTPNAVGVYDQFEDKIYLAVDRSGGDASEIVATLIHEFGHRLWRKVLTSTQRKQYIESFGWFSKNTVEQLWEVIEESNYNIRAATKKVSDPTLVEEMKIRWRRAAASVTRYYKVGLKEFLTWVRESDISPEARTFKNAFLRTEDSDYIKPTTKPESVSVTNYGLTNPEEDFCETFMYYCMDWKMNPYSEERFLTAVGK